MGTRFKTNGISAIFFDLDNTLIATRKGDKLACHKLSELLCEKYAVPCDIATVVCSNFLRAFRKCPENPTMDLDKWRLLLWKQALEEEYNALAGDIYLKWLQLRYHYLALTPDTLTLLNKLKQHYLLGLITNGPSHAQWEKIQRLNLQSYFNIILVSGDLPWEKPNHQIFHIACEYLGVKPYQCMMVGDKLETDILGGIQANLGSTVWIPLSSEDLGQKELNPDYVLEDITELPTVLPNNPKVPAFSCKRNSYLNKRFTCLPELDDCNSNSSDGS